MKRQRVGSSLTEDVQLELREEILRGTLAPGEKLLVQPLSRRLGVSLSVVREALSRLAEQGLVRSAPQLGFTVRPLSLDDLADLTRVRSDIEDLMIRRAVAEGDLAWEASVVAAHHRLAGTPLQLDGQLNPAWRTAHAAFHAAVTDGCQSPLLRALRLGLFDQAELYRAWSVRASQSRDVAQEHAAVCAAVVDRDAGRTAALAAAHIQRTTDLLVAAELAGASQQV
jgi:DNA-binding GntR family transcriptional regulator